jgi:DNA-binding response OmpR family regulator
MAKILVVSADRVAADAMADILAEGDHTTTVVASVGGAVDRLRAQAYDAVITDAFGRAAPGEIDWKTMRPLLEAAASSAVLLCSEWLTEAATEEAERHFVDIIWKPIDPDDLLARVDAALASS